LQPVEKVLAELLGETMSFISQRLALGTKEQRKRKRVSLDK
jgi:hypothetical protein